MAEEKFTHEWIDERQDGLFAEDVRELMSDMQAWLDEHDPVGH